MRGGVHVHKLHTRVVFATFNIFMLLGDEFAVFDFFFLIRYRAWKTNGVYSEPFIRFSDSRDFSSRGTKFSVECSNFFNN